MDRRALLSAGAVAVAGLGARTALGSDARTTFDGMRAGLGRLLEQTFLRARRGGAPITVGLDAALDPGAPPAKRLLEMATAAAREALRSAPEAVARQPLGVMLAMAPDRPGLDAKTRRQVAHALVAALDDGRGRVSRSHCRLVATGHDGGLAGLYQAARWLNAREIGACLVGGVESCADLAFLDWLDAQGRLKAEDRPHGHIPGEAAAFLLLTRGDSVGRQDGAGRAWLAALSRATEPSPWYSGRPCLAEGLTDAIAGVFVQPAFRALRASVVYADLNGEPWRADEWATAYLRTADNQGEPMHLRHPADCWGDVGAASGPLLAVMAALEVVHPRMRAGSALVFAASDVSPGRAAGLIVSEEKGA